MVCDHSHIPYCFLSWFTGYRANNLAKKEDNRIYKGFDHLKQQMQSK